MTIKRKSSSDLPTAFALQHPEISSRVLKDYQNYPLIIRLPHSNSVTNRATSYTLLTSLTVLCRGEHPAPEIGWSMSIPLVNRLKRTELIRRTRKAFLLVGECLWSGHGRREGAATDKLQVAACVCCLLTPPGLCDSKLASLSPRLGNSFRNSRTKGRHS